MWLPLLAAGSGSGDHADGSRATFGALGRVVAFYKQCLVGY